MPFALAEDGVRLYLEVSGVGELLLLIAGRGVDHHLWNLVRSGEVTRGGAIMAFADTLGNDELGGR